MASITINPAPSTDASTQIQNAINTLGPAGGTIIIAPGTYQMRTCINVVNVANITIKGDRATLIAMATMPQDTTGHFFLFQGCKSLVVSGLSFDGNAANRGIWTGTPQSLCLNWSNDIQIIGCNFTNAVCDDIFMWGGAGSPMPPCTNVRITGCTFNNANRNAISVVNGAYVRIDHNAFTNINSHDPMAAVDVEPNVGDPVGITHHVTIDNNTVTNCYHGFVCWNIAGPYEIHYDSNTLNYVGYPIENQAPSSTITWNHISFSKAFPICTGSGSVAQIYSNRIYKCPQWAIGPTDVLGTNIIVV